MVNPGHSSRGCRTCRMRRVKCDEAHPSCSRCTKAGKICLGYTTSSQPTFRPEVQMRLARAIRSTTMINNSYNEHSALNRYQSISANVITHTGILHSLRWLPTYWTSDQVTKLTTDVIVEGFQSLQSHSQSVQSRTSLHLKYGLALHQLGKTLASQPNVQELFVPALLFAFYEVNSSFRIE
jgi:hypothetical protein